MQRFGRPVRKRAKPVAYWKNEIPQWYVPIEKSGTNVTPTTGARKRAERIATRRRIKEKDELE